MSLPQDPSPAPRDPISRHGSELSRIVVHTFDVMLKSDVHLAGCERSRSTRTPFEVSGVVGVSGDRKGGLVLSFPHAVARAATSRMLGLAHDEPVADEDVVDCVAELANIVAGNFMARLQAREHATLHISLPSVVMGSHHVIWPRGDTTCELLLFGGEFGAFGAEFNLRDEPPDPTPSTPRPLAWPPSESSR